MNPRARYDEIADDLAARDPNIELSQMMGMPCIKSGGKMVIGYERTGEMVFKLTDDSEHSKALGSRRRQAVRSLRQGKAVQGVGAGAVRSRERVAQPGQHRPQTPRWLNQPPASSSR